MTKVVFILIGGASGSGKTTLSDLLIPELHKKGKTAHKISMDDYFHEIPKGMDHNKYLLETNLDRPEMIHLDWLKRHIIDLNKGLSIIKPIYDFKTSTHKSFETVAPTEYIIIEGIFALYFARELSSLTNLSYVTVNVSTSSYKDIVQRRIERNLKLYKMDPIDTNICEKKFVGPGFFKYTASGAVGADIQVLNDSQLGSNCSLNLAKIKEEAVNIASEVTNIVEPINVVAKL